MIDFSRYDLEGLLRLFNKDFYKVIKDERMFFDYLKAISYKICDNFQTVTYPTLKIESIERDVVGRTKSMREIVLNDKYFYAFPLFKKLNNLFFVYEMIITIIHETRHFLQANAKVNMEPLIKNFLSYKAVAPSDALKYISYGTAINEIDARYFIYQILKDQPEYEKYLQSVYSIQNEIKLSKHKSSHALSIKKAIEQIQQVIPQKQFAIINMDECYSNFLKEIGIKKEYYQENSKQFSSLSEVSNLNTKINTSSMSRFIKEVYEDLSLARRASREDLNAILNETKFKMQFMPAITEDDKMMLNDMFRLRALLHYETDMLYKLIAPEYFDMLERKGEANPEDIKQFFMVNDILEKRGL